MKKTLVLACTLALIAVAGFAQPPGAPHVTLADIMAPAAVAAPAIADQNQPVFASNRGRISGEKATCIANCTSGTVSCTTSAPGATCIAQNVNCPTTPGYVTCDGVTKYCAACVPPCNEGAIRFIITGYCCDNNTKEKEQQVCSGGVWQFTGTMACFGPCGPRDPIQP
jgi:hypothetical protein